MTVLAPSLRPDLQRDGEYLVDPILGRRLRLDTAFRAVVDSLTSPQTHEEVAAKSQVEVGTVGRILAMLDSHQLLDTPEARAFVDEAQAVETILAMPPDDVPILIREDAAFTCTQCGSCCGGITIGPVMEDTLAGLDDDMPALVEATGCDSPFVVLPDGSGSNATERIICRTRDGWCVFLDDNGLCSIHARVGGDKKPRVCQLFPWTFTATPKGIAVSISNECRGFAESRGGQPLATQTDTIRALLRLVPGGRAPRLRPVVHLAPGTPMTFAHWERLEEDLHLAIDTHAADPAAAFLALRDRVAADLDPAGVRAEPDREALVRDLDALTGDMDETMVHLLRASTPPGPQVVVRTDTLDLLRTALGTLRADMDRVVAPLERRDQGALFAALMHQRLMSKDILEAPSVVHGVAWMALSWFLGKASIVKRARTAKRRHLVLQDLVDAVAPLSIPFRSGRTRAALSRHDGAVVDLFFHRLDALVTLGSTLADTDDRVELHAG